MHRRERHPRYMGSFLDFWVGIPEVAGDMKLIFICFALLTHLALLLCFRFFFFSDGTYLEVAGRNGDHRLC